MSFIVGDIILCIFSHTHTGPTPLLTVPYVLGFALIKKCISTLNTYNDMPSPPPSLFYKTEKIPRNIRMSQPPTGKYRIHFSRLDRKARPPFWAILFRFPSPFSLSCELRTWVPPERLYWSLTGGCERTLPETQRPLRYVHDWRIFSCVFFPSEGSVALRLRANVRKGWFLRARATV